MTYKIAVLTGGSTPERDVALAGAGQVVDALRRTGYEVSVIDTTSGLIEPEDEASLIGASVRRDPPSLVELKALEKQELGAALLDLDAVKNSDAIFLVLHGRQGEGGDLQALLESAGIQFTGSDAAGSESAMDKDVAKQLFRKSGILTAPWAMWPADTKTVEQLGLPLIVKPSRVGSTLGLTLVEDLEELDAAVSHAARFDDAVMLESFLKGRELTVGVLGDEALAVGEIKPQHEIFDYECKYTPGMTEEIFPADLPKEVEDRIREAALKAHRALKLRDMSRIDFILDEEHNAYCLEANTLPGMTATSLLPQSAEAHGISFTRLCDSICKLALSRAAGTKSA
ncbi:MAG: D-alanine--D-alanine ligase [Gemmatimonadota bacterium]|nr:D-alanine--D-alanine ligase [Gemmatimonadota bacterium]MDH5804404.1 D-alanine--D-alanine ligase [Gemmatimonadota bacterium]